ncbi:MAG: acyltransferase family protein [Muribaculaceae bacterium]
MINDLLNSNIISEVKKDNCFDFLRYVFFTLLIIMHFCVLSEVEVPFFASGTLVVRGFFVITGFLVAYSFVRGNYDIKSYARKRFARIVPAYVVAILFCVVLGAVMSSLSLGEFFSDGQTWRYTLYNMLMLNWIEPCLPGVFESNFLPQMDGSLWTMKMECLFYVVVPMVIWLMRRLGKHVVALPVVVACLCLYNWMTKNSMFSTYFVSGMVLLLYLDWLVKYKHVLAGVALLSEVLLYSDIFPAIYPVVNALEPLSYAWLIVYIAYNVKALNFMRRYDNITYGLFLYHWPVIQALVALGLHSYNIAFCFATAFVTTATLAWLSWHFIEQPLMRISKK